MSSVLSRIQIIMEANAANYNNELRRARNHSRSTFGQISKAAGKMALGVGVALAGMGAASIKTAQSFETAMAEVNKTTDFVSENGLANLKTELEDLSKTMPLAFEELASIAAAGGQSGVAGEALADFTQTIAKMSIAFDISAGETADAMAKIASSYEVPIESVQGLGDAINEVSNSGAVKANELVDFMLRVGQSASNFNITGEAAAAMGGALIDAGGRVEVVGTAMSTIFNNLSSTEWVDKNTAALQGLGLDMAEFKETAKTDGLAAFMMLKEGVQQSSNPMETLTGLFDNAGKHAASLFSESSKLEGMLGSVGEVAGVAATHIGSLDREYQVMANTQDNAWVLMTNSIRLGAAALGEAFLPAVKEVTDALIPMIQNMAAWAKENPELIVTIAKVTAVVLGAVVAVASISSVVTAAVGAWTALSTVFGVAKVVILAISGPIGLAVVAIAALVTAAVLLYKNWDEIKAKATEVWGSITSYIGNKITEIKNYFSTNFPAMTAIVSGALKTITTVISTGFALIKNTVTTVLATVRAVIKGDFGAIPGIIGNGLKSAASIVSNMMGSILNIIKETGAKLFTLGRDFINGFVSGIKSVGSNVASAASSMVGSAIEAVRKRQNSNSDAKETIKLGKDFSSGMATGVRKGAKAVVTEAQRMTEQAIQAVEDGIESWKKRISLFGDNSELSSLLYDINAGKYAGASDARIRELVLLATAYEQVEARAKAANAIQQRFDKWQDARDKLRSNATGLIRDRAAQFGQAKTSASSGLQDMLGGLEQQSPMGKIQADYEARNAIIEQYEQTHTNMVETANEARIASDQAYMAAKRDLILNQGEALFGDMAGLAKAFVGEQSSIYRGLFAVEKIFAIAQSAMAIQVSIAKAMSVGFPANIPLIGQAVAQGAKIASNIKSIAMPVGQAHDGIANVPREGTWVLDKNERVVKPEDNKKLTRFLDNNNGKSGDVNVSVSVTVNGNQSSIESSHQAGKALGDIIAAKITNWAQNEKRPGGLLYG